eukprot:CAMPEP_0119139092 /NCGR_PEP_ID=MMETSP1310-20130426/26862_1 /TAXON_ID=464262 /ORGANISM="Genus nov. species nov., Strain RCC2339" /LENGTH=322 /DNA_ID=CAMNT_0007130351 /DNA_START=233 /DNA_END=1198 /DNA_ORIENTATION=-
METELFPSLGMGEGSHNLRLSDAFGTDSVMYMFDEPGVEETGGSGSPSSLLVSTSDFSSESSPAFVPDGPCPTLAPYAADAGLETGTGLDDVVVSPVSVTVTPRTSPAPDASPVSSHVTARLAQMSNPFAVKRETPTPRSAKERRAVLSATRKRKRELQRRVPPAGSTAAGSAGPAGPAAKLVKTEEGARHAELSPEELQRVKKEQRMIRNRESARQSRLRTKQKIESLEHRCAQLERECGELRERNGALEAEVQALRGQLAVARIEGGRGPALEAREGVGASGILVLAVLLSFGVLLTWGPASGVGPQPLALAEYPAAVWQ